MNYRSLITILRKPVNCVLLYVFLLSCSRSEHPLYTYRYPGYYYKLLSFDSEHHSYENGSNAWLSLSFATQSDSVFWDSGNNLSDRYFVVCDSSNYNNYIAHFVSVSEESDSACLLIKTGQFFSQQFNSQQVPLFSARDSVVKVYLKIRKIFNADEYDNFSNNLLLKEQSRIAAYFGSEAEALSRRDPSGFYWVAKPVSSGGGEIRPGSVISVNYRGRFLNGRIMDDSGGEFRFVYGTPDQLLPGLNNIIPRLKSGQNAKIILPSPLAFGENGSSDKTVPPFTPLLYEIEVNNIE